MTNDTRQQSGLIHWFMHNHVAANILMLLFVVGGVISVSNMRTETFPSIDPNTVTVSVSYPGATPYEVADGITSRVEEELIGIDGIKRITSTAQENHGTVMIELKDFANGDVVYNDIETAVNGLSDFPPENAERPIITKSRLTPNVISLALHGQADEKTLRYWADVIEDELRQLNGVALTSLRGVRDYQISIEIAERALQEYGLTLANVRDAITSFSSDIPAGTIESERGDVLLRIQEKRFTGNEFGAIALRTLPDGSSLTISDIGRVIDGFDDSNLISRFNGEPAAFIDVKRSDSEDTLTVAKTVKDYLATATLPQGLTLTLQDDATVALKDRISLMMRNAIIGFMLVFCILLLFLDLRLAFWTSAAIPISFFGGMMIMYFFGYSLNMISLFAMIVVLGIVVDDGIITGESIFDAQEKNPDDPNATLTGVKHVIAPVTVGVTTSMAAFAPLIFSTGTLGQIVSIIPAVVISILFVSLLEAYFILPAHLSGHSRWSAGLLATLRDNFARGMARIINNIVLPAARFCIRWRYATIAAFVAFAIITGAMVSSGVIRFIFFPQIESDRVKVTLTMPVGTPFTQTTDTMLAIESIVATIRDDIRSDSDIDAVESVSLTIGQTNGATGGPHAGSGGGSASHMGEMRIQLVPSDYRTISASEMERRIREQTDKLPNIDTLEFQSALAGNDADIEVELSHSDDAMLEHAANQLKTRLRAVSGAIDVQDNALEGKIEYVFSLTPEGLAAGLSPIQLGQQLRAAYFGTEAQRFQRGRSEVIVYVRYPKAERDSLNGLRTSRIRLADGREVPLSQVATIREQRGYSQITTVDGRRIINISADADTNVATPNAIMDVITTDIMPTLKARYPGLRYNFAGESRDQMEDLASLGQNMLIALILIYVLLGAQLRSYIQPFIIMSAIPFGVVGAIWGHILLGHDLTFISMFGIVALTGVVVNDSVVLIDYFNKRRLSGNDCATSALAAIGRRFRPIMLTTLSTCLGLLPILLETSLQAQFLIPMVISLAMGILFATVIILVLIPCLLLVIDDIQHTAFAAKQRIARGS